MAIVSDTATLMGVCSAEPEALLWGDVRFARHGDAFSIWGHMGFASCMQRMVFEELFGTIEGRDVEIHLSKPKWTSLCEYKGRAQCLCSTFKQRFGVEKINIHCKEELDILGRIGQTGVYVGEAKDIGPIKFHFLPRSISLDRWLNPAKSSVTLSLPDTPLTGL